MRRRVLDLARVAFVLLAVGFAVWGFHGRTQEVGAALRRLTWGDAVVSAGATFVGLWMTALLWRTCLRWTGHTIALRDAAAVFFVGQLGKYVPGSIWNFAAQAHLGRDHGVDARSSVAASTLFLLIHTATGGAVAAVLGLAGVLDLAGPSLLWVAAAVGATVAIAPVTLRLLGGRLVGRARTFRVSGRSLAAGVGSMLVTWAAYGASLVVLLPSPSPDQLLLCAGAFAAAHAAGVVVVIAPAGIGVRESVLIALLTPTTGLAGAAAAALAVRIVHTLADVAMATASWLVSRRRSLSSSAEG